MGKLVFYYGTMGSAKTANALITRYQYIQNRRSVWLIIPITRCISKVIQGLSHSTRARISIGLQRKGNDFPPLKSRIVVKMV